MLVCTAARATSAAPSYFPAKLVAGLDFLQDGGAGKHNNPVEPAEWESQAIWQAVPDLVLSVGTGYAVSDQVATTVPRKLGLQGRFFPRLFRLFAELLNSETHWKDHVKQVDKNRRERYIRVNLPLQSEPELDDVSKLQEIKSWSRGFLDRFDFTNAIRAMFAASFFLALDKLPYEGQGGCICVGAICCRSPDPGALLKRMLQEYPRSVFVLDGEKYLGPVDDAQMCIACNTYRKDVQICAKGWDEDFNVHVRFDSRHVKTLSGFPQSAASLSEKQMLEASFGRPDHQTADVAFSGRCKCPSTRKRKSKTPLQHSKRRRL